MHIRTKYLLIAMVLFVAEIVVATKFSAVKAVRGNLSDFLVVILLYYVVKLFYDIAPFTLSVLIFIFACGAELSQYFHLADALGLRRGSLLGILMGSMFSLADILMYFSGCLTAYFSDEYLFLKAAPELPKSSSKLNKPKTQHT